MCLQQCSCCVYVCVLDLMFYRTIAAPFALSHSHSIRTLTNMFTNTCSRTHSCVREHCSRTGVCETCLRDHSRKQTTNKRSQTYYCSRTATTTAKSHKQTANKRKQTLFANAFANTSQQTTLESTDKYIIYICSS